MKLYFCRGVLLLLAVVQGPRVPGGASVLYFDNRTLVGPDIQLLPYDEGTLTLLHQDGGGMCELFIFRSGGKLERCPGPWVEVACDTPEIPIPRTCSERDYAIIGSIVLEHMRRQEALLQPARRI